MAKVYFVQVESNLYNLSTQLQVQL